MNRPKYLSPSALSCWEENEDEYYLRYLSPNRPPKIKQTEAMSVGSGFDARVKDYLAEKLFGKGVKPELEYDSQFNSQVEPHNRDFSAKAGLVCFEAYKTSGALAWLLAKLQKADEVRMESRTIAEVNGVPLGGVPDLDFRIGRYRIVFDWKVNGYCSQADKTPAQGYAICRDGWIGKASRSHGKPHGSYWMEFVEGVGDINSTPHLESLTGLGESGWATQLSTYAWVTGTPVGEEIIAFVDQLCCGKNGIRVASHRSRITGPYQEKRFQAYKNLWDVIHSEHIFRDVSVEASKERCQMLDSRAAAFTGEHGDRWRELEGR